MKDILLSIVATSRNDNHGKNLQYRMQQFVSGFVEQCKRHNLKAELILVEWNPPDNTPPLSQALHYPQDKGPCSIRIITVPKEMHMQLDHADKIPLFQMIGKNVGIRRAKGKFVLATNIDILFSDALMRFLKSKLKGGHLYRVDRLDVPEILPDNTPFHDVLEFCSKNVLRVNGKAGTFIMDKRTWMDRFRSLLKRIINKSKSLSILSYHQAVINYVVSTFCTCRNNLAIFFTKLYNSTIKDYVNKSIPFILHMLWIFTRGIKRMIGNCLYFFIRPFLRNTFFYYTQRVIKQWIKAVISWVAPNHKLFLHTNACGDFTLLSSEDWFQLRGYPEWNIFSWHLDSIFLFQAMQHGIREKDLPRRMSIYHIEHEAGSGFSPEYAHLLFKRLHEKKIPYIDNKGLDDLISEMNESQENVVYNDENWGMSHLTLKEINL